MTDRLLLCGDYVVSDVRLPPTRDGAVLFEDGYVAVVENVELLKAKYPDVRAVGGPGFAVLPGLIDAHQHGRGVTNIQRGIPDGFLEQWLVRLRGLWPVDPYLATLAAAIRLVRSGVTTAMHHFSSVGILPLQEEMTACLNAYRDVGLRVTFTFDFRDRNSYVYAEDATFLASLGADLAKEITNRLPPRVLPLPAASRGLLNEIRKEFQSSTIRFAIGPQGADWSSDKALSEIAKLAAQENLPIHSHMLETRFQRQASLQEFGKTPVQRFADLGLLGSRISLAHMVWADTADLDTVRDRGSIIVHNPASNLRLHSGIAPVCAMLDREIPVAIGMDGMSISDQGDYFQDMRLCGGLHFKASGDGLTSDQLWRMLYEGGRKATFWGDEIGLLKPRARADAILVETQTSSLVAPLDPDWRILDRILREGSPDKIKTVVIGGRIVMDDGELMTVDEGQLLQRIEDQAKAVEKSTLNDRRALVARLERAVVDFYQNSQWQRDEALNCTQLQ